MFEVERGVLEVEVLRPLRPVGDAGDGHLAEDRLEVPAMTRLGGPVRPPRAVADRPGAPLPARPQVEVVLEELAAQLAAIDIETTLELVVGELRRLGVSQETDEALVERVRRAEGAGRFSWCAAISAARPASARTSRAVLDSR